MDKNLYVTNEIEIKRIKEQYHLTKEILVDLSVGYDGSVWLLFAASVPERIQGMFVNTQSCTIYHAVCLWVDWNDGVLLGEEKFDLGFHTMNFNMIQPIGDEIFLLGARARYYSNGTVDKNGVIVNKSGEKQAEFCLGDGIEDCYVTEEGRIITSYFDEGIFGNFGWEKPLGTSGLIVWDREGNTVWKNEKYPIYDCYAMNVDENGCLWFYYYAEFNLVKTNFVSDIIYYPKTRGFSAFLINRSQTGILMDGGYDKYSQFDFVELKGGKLGRIYPVDIIWKETPLLLKKFRFRGAKAAMLDNRDRLFCIEVI